jgi:hypothetical protein
MSGLVLAGGVDVERGVGAADRLSLLGVAGAIGRRRLML